MIYGTFTGTNVKDIILFMVMGYYRVGCTDLPNGHGKRRWKEFADFPTYQRAYVRALAKMLEAIIAAKKPTKWKSGEDVFRWWMEDDNVDGQMSLEDYLGVMP